MPLYAVLLLVVACSLIIVIAVLLCGFCSKMSTRKKKGVYKSPTIAIDTVTSPHALALRRGQSVTRTFLDDDNDESKQADAAFEPSVGNKSFNQHADGGLSPLSSSTSPAGTNTDNEIDSAFANYLTSRTGTHDDVRACASTYPVTDDVNGFVTAAQLDDRRCRYQFHHNHHQLPQLQLQQQSVVTTNVCFEAEATVRRVGIADSRDSPPRGNEISRCSPVMSSAEWYGQLPPGLTESVDALVMEEAVDNADKSRQRELTSSASVSRHLVNEQRNINTSHRRNDDSYRHSRHQSMDNDNRRIMVDAASAAWKRQTVIGNTGRRLPPEPTGKITREITAGNVSDANRFAGRVDAAVRSYDTFNDCHQTPVRQNSSDSVDICEQVNDRKWVASNLAEHSKNITDMTAAERQLRRQQDYRHQERPWNSLEFPPESAVINGRRCPLPSALPSTDHPEYENAKQASIRRTARPLGGHRVDTNTRESVITSRRASPGEFSRGRVPVRTASFDVVSGRKFVEASNYRAAVDETPESILTRMRPTSFQTTSSSSLSRTRSDCRQYRQRQPNASPFDFHRQNSQDRRTATSEQPDDSWQTGDEPKWSRTACPRQHGLAMTAARHQESSRRCEYSHQPIVLHHVASNDLEATGAIETVFTSDDDDHHMRTRHLSPTTMMGTRSRSKQMKPRDDSGYKSIESQLSRLSFGGWISEQTSSGHVDQQHSPGADCLPPATTSMTSVCSTFTRHVAREQSATSANSCENYRDASAMKSGEAGLQKREQSDHQTKVKRFGNTTGGNGGNTTDQSQWMVEWVKWRTGQDDSPELNKTGSVKEITPRLSTLPSENETKLDKQQVDGVTESPEKTDVQSMTTSGSGTKLDVLKNLTRGLEKTFSDAEQSLGSVLSQAAERLLKRRTSSADGTGPSSAAVADLAAELSLAAGYGIPARCADSFVRTSYKTASRRRREFRTRCGRLNNEEVTNNGYRDSV